MTQQRENVRPRNRDEELREVTQQLKNVRRQLQERDGQLSEKDRQIRERDEQLREMGNQLTDIRRQLQEKDKQLREKTQQLTNVEGQLQERDGEMREKTQHLKNAEEQLQEKDEEVSSLERRLEEKEQQVDELEDSLSATSQALNKLSRQQSPDWVIPRDQIQLTEKCLGRGGWGIVVKGKYCGCTVAVKQIYDDLLKSSSYYRELFEREMNIASRCRHPCLLQFIGATNDEGTPLFVTELMETSLRALSEQRSLSPTEVYVISLDVAQALNYLHLKKPSPIIHRDISSANVLLWREADQWRGKVSDYGTANFKRDIMTACPGSRIYSAPEALTKNQTAKVCVHLYIWVIFLNCLFMFTVNSLVKYFYNKKLNQFVDWAG